MNISLILIARTSNQNTALVPKGIAKSVFVLVEKLVIMSQNSSLSNRTLNSVLKEDKLNKKHDLNAVTKRLQSELMTLMTAGEKSVSAFPDGENLFYWVATIMGPLDTVYEGLTYKLRLEFPHTYPYTAPVVRFTTPCFHPNVDNNGNICLDILKEKWSALYDVRTILISIQSLLGEPNNDSPLNEDAATMWSNPKEFRKHLQEIHKKQASS